MANTIAGTISGSLSGVIVSAGGCIATSVAGTYTITAVPYGVVTIIPQKPGYTFSPPSYTIVFGADVSGYDFTATAESYPWFTTNFQLRTGSTTFKPHAQIGRNVEIEQGEPIYIERGELVDFTLSDYFVGFKQKVIASFQVLYSKVVTPEAGYSSIEAVLNAMTAGASLEYSIDGGSTWVVCYPQTLTRKKLDNKNVGFTFELELQSAGIVTSSWRVT